MQRHLVYLIGLAIWAPVAHAIPFLQLDINNGVYVGGSEESVMTSSNIFELYALADSTNGKFNGDDVFHISAALTPKTAQPGGDFGSFSVSYSAWDEVTGQTVVVTNQVVAVTADMTFGIPPLEANWDHDGGDLGAHDIFNTYYYEMTFRFSGANTASPYNVENAGGGGLDPGSSGSLLYETFAFDLTNLDTSYDLHFDLYHDKVKRDDDVDIQYFAPFSKDAGTTNRTVSVPTPDSLLISAIGFLLLGLGLFRQAVAK